MKYLAYLGVACVVLLGVALLPFALVGGTIIGLCLLVGITVIWLLGYAESNDSSD